MKTLHDLIELKPAGHSGERVHVAGVSASVLDAAKVMNAARVGAVVVTDASRMVGIFTERDVLTRVVAAGLDPSSTTLGEVMTAEVLTATPQTPIGEARSIMRERRIRHLPVLDDGRLVGMISIGDLNLVETKILAETVRTMEAFIAGEVVR